MAGAGKNRQRKERKAEKEKDSPPPEPSVGSSPRPQPSPPGGDGNRDPQTRPRPTPAARPGGVIAVRADRNIDWGFREALFIEGMRKKRDPETFYPGTKLLPNGPQLQAVTEEDIPKRGKYNPTGQPTNLTLNTHHVEKFPTGKITQWDVAIDIKQGEANDKKPPRALIKRIWNHPKVRQHFNGEPWLFDGFKIAYSKNMPIDIPDPVNPHYGVLHEGMKDKKPTQYMVMRINLSLDEDKKGQLEEQDSSSSSSNGNSNGNGNGNGDSDPKKGWDPKAKGSKKDIHTCKIETAKTISMTSLEEWLRGTLKQYTDDAKEATTFLDHLLREKPGQSMTVIKRNFFARGQQNRMSIGQPVEAFKGVYQGIRQAHVGLGKPGCLSVNVDVANTTFWEPTPVNTTVRWLINARDDGDAYNLLKRGQRGEWSPALKEIQKRLRRLPVVCEHRNTGGDHYTIDTVIPENAFEHKFEFEGKQTSVFDFFQKRHGVRLRAGTLPLLQTSKKAVLPMELCRIEPNQRYPFKLSERQTSQMIKFAATYPNDRWNSIRNGLQQVNWANDEVHRFYGLRISQNPAKVKAQILPNPKVAFANEAIDPRTSGRWDLKNKVFLGPHAVPKDENKPPLKSWGVCIIPGRGSPSPEGVKPFITQFISIFQGHGGVVMTKQPPIIVGSPNAAKCVEELYNKIGSLFRERAQLMVFIVPSREAAVYNRIKKSADCRYGVVSQVLQSAQVGKSNAQYCSNVSMKVNAKLGGFTAQARSQIIKGSWFSKPTLVMGADVSHAAPYSDAGSCASITMSWDRHAIRYAALIETNGHRMEMITPENWKNKFKPMYQKWVLDVAGGQHAQHLIYFRDGVSDRQYPHVLQEEVNMIREMIYEVAGKRELVPKITCIVGSKRHHVRFFPDKGDRNNNPLPGTLVEQHVTHPFDLDFYLCSHSAIKGTARPVHYYVILDEAKMDIKNIQNMIYEQSYQYVRSTTPVSLHPAIYYAHLAANRATSHYNEPTVSSGDKKTKTGTSAKERKDIKPLINMDNSSNIQTAMWYV
ncbi:MAG: hypothetical protein M1831_005297 [Alyxoria varia]|nr:MAG: hypothetical protein M1831_005297 [Alyxoria varia]